MTLTPLFNRVLIKRLALEETTSGGLYIPDNAREKPQRGQVVAHGPGRRREDGTFNAPDLNVGDLVLFSKYAGVEINLKDETYLMMREEDILGVLTATTKGE